MCVSLTCLTHERTYVGEFWRLPFGLQSVKCSSYCNMMYCRKG